MAKRLTDTDKWKKPFIKSLPPEYKLLWLYLIDDCDIAGIWQVDFEVAELRLGIKLSQEKALRFFKEKIVAFDNGTKWFVQDFISFQYGNLTDKNKMYNPVNLILSKYKMGHLSPINGVKDKDKDKDKDIIGGVGDFSTNNIPVKKPPFEDVHALFVRNGKTEAEARTFYNHFDGLGWMKGITPIINWTAIANNWIANPISTAKQQQPAAGVKSFAAQVIANKQQNGQS